jgi:hypothetical protein
VSGSDLGSSKEGVIVSIDIKTTILHYKPLADRKQNMILQMEKHGFVNYSFYEQFDGNELDEETIRQNYSDVRFFAEQTESKAAVYERLIPGSSKTVKPLNIGEISIATKFGKVFQELSVSDGDHFLLFEDDVILCENFETHLTNFLSRTPNDWDAIYFGSGASMKPKNIKEDCVAYLMNHPATRCADSILIKKSAVSDLAKTWFPFHLPADWELGYQHFLHNHRVYWWEPSLTRQGSEYGVFKSSLR